MNEKKKISVSWKKYIISSIKIIMENRLKKIDLIGWIYNQKSKIIL